MTFDFPIRARCIEPNSFFHRGEEVTVLRMLGRNMCVVKSRQFCVEGITKASRFKPVVRVKAKCQPSIDLAAKRYCKQRDSWIRANAGWN